MEINRNTELFLCNLAFQEYNLRQNILGLIFKEKMTKDEKEKNKIRFEIANLVEKADYLLSLRENQKNGKSL